MLQKDIVKELRQVIKGALEEFGTERNIQVGPNVLTLVDEYNMMVWKLEKEEGIELEMIPYEPTIAQITEVLSVNHN